MTGSFLSAWILFPAVLLAGSLGCGLLVRRLSGGALSAGLVAPVGFALVVVVCASVTSSTSLAPGAGATVVALALLGYVLEARAGGLRLPPRPRTLLSPALGSWLWPVLAALVAFAAIGGPAFLTGTATWTGYTRIVDIAFQIDLAQHLAETGPLRPPLDSSFHVLVNKLTAGGYPSGGQAALGSIAALVRTDVAWCYQAYLAFAAAMGALAIFSLLGRVTTNGALRAVGAAVAIQPNLLYGYALEGGIKELTTATLLMTIFALLSERLPGEGPRRGVIPAAVAISAAFAAFSIGISPWLGLVLSGLLIVTLMRPGPRRYVVESWALLAALTILLSFPSLLWALNLASIAESAVSGVVELGLGNLAAPVPAWSSAGVWLTGDYRFPLVHVTATHAFDVLVLVLALLGIAFALRRRYWTIGMLGLSAPIALYYWIDHGGPWVQLKAFTITSTFALALAFIGAGAIWELPNRWARWLGWLAATAIAGAVLYGNAITYHDTSLAPTARYQDLAAIGKRYAGQGPLLFPSFDEYSEYFLRDERATDLVNPAYGRFPLTPGASPPPGVVVFAWDLNQVSQPFLQTFPLIVTTRSPVASRAPSNYDLIQQTHYFDVWRRDRPSATIIHHFPLSSSPLERVQQHFCPAFVAEARRAGAGAEVAFARASPAVVTGLTLGTHPDYWRVAGPDTLIAYGAGTGQLKVVLPQAGRYDIWMQGSVGRPLAIYLDGHRLTSIGYEERYPGQFLLIGGVQLSSGAHAMRVVRGNGSLHPGSGDPSTDTVGRTLGAIVFSLENSYSDRAYVAGVDQAGKVCAAQIGYQWLEILKPGGAPPNALPALPQLVPGRATPAGRQRAAPR